MDFVKGKGKKKNLILKTWERCRSIHGGRDRSNSNSLSKSKSCKTKPQVAPEGCFSVYVGPEKQRFVIKAKCANHPLFKMLLEDAELEYGYSSEGPILLPCDVDLFYKVLAEMDSKETHPGPGCGFITYGSCSPFINPSRRLVNSDMAKGYGSYGILTPSRFLKLN